MKPSPSPAQRRALTAATERPNGAICPIAKVHGYAEGSMIESLIRRGWAGSISGIPYITAAGRAVVAKEAV